MSRVWFFFFTGNMQTQKQQWMMKQVRVLTSVLQCRSGQKAGYWTQRHCWWSRPHQRWASQHTAQTLCTALWNWTLSTQNPKKQSVSSHLEPINVKSPNFKNESFKVNRFLTKNTHLRIPADGADVHSQGEITLQLSVEHHNSLSSFLCGSSSQKVNEVDVVFNNLIMFILLRFDSVFLNVNCKPPYFSSCGVNGDSPSSALMISLAGSCICGASEYSSEMTVSEMEGVRMTSFSCLTSFFSLPGKMAAVSSALAQSLWTKPNPELYLSLVQWSSKILALIVDILVHMYLWPRHQWSLTRILSLHWGWRSECRYTGRGLQTSLHQSSVWFLCRCICPSC